MSDELTAKMYRFFEITNEIVALSGPTRDPAGKRIAINKLRDERESLETEIMSKIKGLKSETRPEG